MNKRKSQIDQDDGQSKRIRTDDTSGCTNKNKTLSTRIRKLPPPMPSSRTASGRASSVATTSAAKRTNVINVSRKKSAINYIRRIKSLVLELGATKIILNTLSAAIPFTLQLIPMIRKHLGNSTNAIRFLLRTRTVDVIDQVLPTDKEADIEMHQRSQSALRVVMLVGERREGEQGDSDQDGNQDEQQQPQPHAHAHVHPQSHTTKPKNRGVKRRLKDERKREQKRAENEAYNETNK